MTTTSFSMPIPARPHVKGAEQLLVVPYAALRVPLAIVERSLRLAMQPRSRGRVVFDHGLGVLDHWAGLILDDHGIADSGRMRIAHAGAYRPGTVSMLNVAGRNTAYATTRPA